MILHVVTSSHVGPIWLGGLAASAIISAFIGYLFALKIKRSDADDGILKAISEMGTKTAHMENMADSMQRKETETDRLLQEVTKNIEIIDVKVQGLEEKSRNATELAGKLSEEVKSITTQIGILSDRNDRATSQPPPPQHKTT